MGTVVDVDSGMSWPSSYGDFEYFKKQQNSNRIICSISSSTYFAFSWPGAPFKSL